MQSLYNAVNTMYKNVGLPGLKVLHLGGDDVPDSELLKKKALYPIKFLELNSINDKDDWIM